MANSAALVFVTLFATPSVLGKLGAPGGPLKTEEQSIDIFKIWENFPVAVSISDADNDTIFECMTVRRLKLDPVTKETTYNFDFPSTGQVIQVDSWLSDYPGIGYFTFLGDTTTRETKYYYTDYKTCIIVDFEFQGHQCTLWTTPELKDNVPQDCIDRFVDVCGVVPPQHSKDLCPDGEGDY